MAALANFDLQPCQPTGCMLGAVLGDGRKLKDAGCGDLTPMKKHMLATKRLSCTATRRLAHVQILLLVLLPVAKVFLVLPRQFFLSHLATSPSFLQSR